MAVAVLGLAAFAPSTANAAFTPAVNLSDAGLTALEEDVASDGSGGGFVVWQQDPNFETEGAIAMRSISPTGAIGPEVPLSNPSRPAFAPAIASTPNGDAIAIWTLNDGSNVRVQARPIFANGVVGALENVSPPGENAFEPEIAIDPSGDAVIAWRLGGGVVKARSMSLAGALGPVRTLDSEPGHHGSFPRVAVDASGDALVVWTDTGSGIATSRIRARRISTGGVVGPPLVLTGPGNLGVPEVSTDAAGDAVVVWQREDGAGDFRVQGRTVSATGVLGATNNLSAPGQTAGAPDIATDVDGDTLAVWIRSDGTNFRFQMRPISPAGGIGPTRNITGAGATVNNPGIAMEADGDAVLAWRNSTLGNRAQVRTISAGGALTPAQTVSPPGLHFSSPELAVDPGGDGAAIAWSRFDGTDERVQASRGP